MSLLSHFSVLHFKISSLEEGEVVDVNKLNPRTGAGAYIRTLPTRGPNVALAKIYASGTLPIFATTQEALEKALPLVPEAMRQKNQACLERLYQYFQGTTEAHVVGPVDTSVSVESEPGDVEITIPPAKARGRSAKPKASVPKGGKSPANVVVPEQVTTKVPASVPKGATKTIVSATKAVANSVPKGMAKASTPTTAPVADVNVPEQVATKVPINSPPRGLVRTITTTTATAVANVQEQVTTKVPVNPVPKGVTKTAALTPKPVVNVQQQVTTKAPVNPVPKGLVKTSTSTTTATAVDVNVEAVNVPEQVVTKAPVDPPSKEPVKPSTSTVTTVDAPEQVTTKVPINPVPKGVTTTSTTSTTSTTPIVEVNAPEQVVTKIPTNPIPKGITKTPVTALGKAKAPAKAPMPSTAQSKAPSTPVDAKTSTPVDAKVPLTPFGVPSKAPKGCARTKKVSEPVPTQHEKIQSSSEMMIVKGQTLEVILPGQILEQEDEEPYTHIDLDIFDFEKYPEDYQLLATYFTGLELYLRLACWIQYKHQYLHGREARIVQLMKKVNNAPDKRLALEEYCNIFVAYDMLCAWYAHFSPERATEEITTRVYDRYQHHIGELFHRLYNKYVDPEAKRVVLWFE